ncbi:HD-GYP domain-containing protein [Gracilibacillus kekensis]|uniref:HDIG domain-containing protein n=1 Tax=Gracilibacillus kekensis TaxID=1027249 RepID=A0A1M7IGP8_9BACI|nr:HD-GYP domain-containing protein [Gracilibacillus kekensis]SHM39849.1 HDIG domain-containing protein [Gracilibacillus kekensis]
MQNLHRYSNLLNEEKRTTIWFLWLFYGIYFGYEIVYYYILPQMPWELDTIGNKNGLDFFIYAICILLIPLAYYLMKHDKSFHIKYIFFITFTLTNLIIELIFYLGNDQTYANGNIVELVIILFSPIFVNKTFFYLVSLGTTLKFIIVGVVLQDIIVVIPILMLSILSVVACILLFRFLAYVKAIETSYDKQLEGLVKGVIATLELKDPYTRGHSERVADYANLLVKETGQLKNDEQKFFYYACLLHDIGKIHIPDSILSKPSKLTKEEFDVIKTHPIVGAEAVEEVEGIVDYINVIKQHHERWDGKGYPEGKQGDEIDFLARVTMIADSFDAITSSRSYRKALSLEEAYRIIVEGSGTQFDPDLVDTFQTVYPIWVEYHKNYHDLTDK